MTWLDYAASRKHREAIERAAYQTSEEIVTESIAVFREHLNWLLCDLRHADIHPPRQINDFAETVDEQLKGLEL